jgi:hypothetical protein
VCWVGEVLKENDNSKSTDVGVAGGAVSKPCHQRLAQSFALKNDGQNTTLTAALHIYHVVSYSFFFFLLVARKAICICTKAILQVFFLSARKRLST